MHIPFFAPMNALDLYRTLGFGPHIGFREFMQAHSVDVNSLPQYLMTCHVETERMSPKHSASSISMYLLSASALFCTVCH